MGAFLKEHSYNMVKLFLNQIGLTVFGTMLCISTQNNPPLLIGSSILAIGMMLFIDYTVGWEIGAKDKIRIDGGRLKPMPIKGMLIALGANIPNFILALLIGIGAMIDTASSQSVAVVCNFIIRLLNGMYLGIFKTVENFFYGGPAPLIDVWWWFIVITLPAIFVGWLSYFLGSKNIRIAGIFGIKPKVDGGAEKN
ncbi:MAG: hypothetical protein IJ428_05580 [Clostridia bacterium]|nr:hypothetical protein [Clostridia bacterium]